MVAISVVALVYIGRLETGCCREPIFRVSGIGWPANCSDRIFHIQSWFHSSKFESISSVVAINTLTIGKLCDGGTARFWLVSSYRRIHWLSIWIKSKNPSLIVRWINTPLDGKVWIRRPKLSTLTTCAGSYGRAQVILLITNHHHWFGRRTEWRWWIADRWNTTGHGSYPSKTNYKGRCGCLPALGYTQTRQRHLLPSWPTSSFVAIDQATVTIFTLVKLWTEREAIGNATCW